MMIREANEADLAAVFAIYNDAVISTTATWALDPVEPEEQRQWLAEHQPPYAALVAVEGQEVVGWASMSQYRAKPGYRFTVEDTVYIRPDRHRLGVGRALLVELIRRAQAGGYHAVLAKISSDNEPSLALHRQLGFVEAGREREVGRKFDRWLDLVTMQLLLPELVD